MIESELESSSWGGKQGTGQADGDGCKCVVWKDVGRREEKLSEARSMSSVLSDTICMFWRVQLEQWVTEKIDIEYQEQTQKPRESHARLLILLSLTTRSCR